MSSFYEDSDSDDSFPYSDSSLNPPEDMLVRMRDVDSDETDLSDDADDDTSTGSSSADSPLFQMRLLNRRRNAIVESLILTGAESNRSSGNEEDGVEVAQADRAITEYTPSITYSHGTREASEAEERSLDHRLPQLAPAVVEVEDLLTVAEVGSHASTSVPSTPSTSAKRKTSSPRTNPTPKKAKEESEEDEECCPICFESWTNSGRHRLCSLKCGHLFGLKCIERWIKDASKCPQCNAKAKKADIRAIYAKRLKAVDTTELTIAQTSCEQEREKRRHKEMELAQVKMQYQMAADECRRLKSQLEDMKNAQITSALPNGVRESIETRSSTTKKFTHVKNVIISQSGNCRVMDYCPSSLSIAISQPSPHTNFMPGFGLKKFSAGDLKSSQFIIMHSKAIKDVRFSPHSELILTASLDQTLKITSMGSNSTVHTYKPQRQVWSCCWDQGDPNLLYAGLNNGSMTCYDIRNTSAELYTLSNPASRCPIVSMYHANPHQDTNKPTGLLVQTLQGVTFWQESIEPESSDHKPNYLPLEPGNCAGLQYSHKLKQCLVTYRPGRSYACTTHLLCQLQFPTNSSSQTSGVDTLVMNSYRGGQTHKMLTRNALFSTPSGNNLLCVGDEAKSMVHVYEAKSRGSLLQSLSCSGPALDILSLRVNEKQLLATLTDKELKIYEQKL